MVEAIDQTFYSGLVEAQAEALGDKTYIMYDEGEINFHDFNRSCSKAANALTDLGAEAGDGVALFMGNAPEYLYLFNGVPRAGLTLSSCSAR